jgi:tetratricopeptide (TPR) repeat protein
MAACLECTDLHPRDPAAFRARLLAARTLVAKGEPEKAKKLLEENLNGESLTPASEEWQESLFDLGWLLYRQGKYEEAADRLHEAVGRYPNSPRSLVAQYLVADSRQSRAKQLEAKLKEDRVESTRVARRQEIRQLLSSALTDFRKLQEKLTRRQQSDELSPLQQLVLRNSYFSIGRVLFQLQQYEDAIKAYVMAANRYQGNPEVLDAYVQIARAYRKLNKPAEARSTLEQAKLVLARLKPDVSFQRTTNYSRQQWSQLLESLAAS